MKILLLSGSRADIGYLLPIAEALRVAGEDVCIESLANVIGGEDTPQAIAQRAGMVLSAGGKTLADSKPDLMIVLGDRWEIASGCIAAVLAGVPIAHLASGETTFGSYDDKFRAAIEGMATLKFAFTQWAYEHLRGHVALAGCTSVKAPAEIAPADGTALVILHPETAGDLPYSLANDILPMLEARNLEPFLLGANPDVGSSRFNGGSWPLEEFHARLAKASVILGNSSAGIIEAPILCTPSVDIGNRQKGRPRSPSVFHASSRNLEEIERALDGALKFGKQRVVSPYENERAVEIIVDHCLAYLRHR